MALAIINYAFAHSLDLSRAHSAVSAPAELRACSHDHNTGRGGEEPASVSRESVATGMGEGTGPTSGGAHVRRGVGKRLKEWPGECGESQGQGFQETETDEKTGSGFQEASWALLKCWGLPLSREPLEEFEHGGSVIGFSLRMVPQAACGDKKVGGRGE